MGAWIEIMEVKELEEDDESHPLWVRGLKYAILLLYHQPSHVAPFMGAWIEIHVKTHTQNI